jgi:hypothetical protein
VPWRVALLAPLLVTLVAGAFFVPFLSREREVLVATPQPPPLFEATTIELEAHGGSACAAPIPLQRDTDVARVTAGRSRAAGLTPLRVVVHAPGYSAERTFSMYRNGQALDVPLPDPPRPVDAELCVENAGRGDGLVYASTEERTVGRLRTEVDGKPSDANILVSLLARDRATLWQRRSEIVRGAAGLAPSFAPAWLLWALAALVVAGVPAGVALALRLAPPDGDQP